MNTPAYGPVRRTLNEGDCLHPRQCRASKDEPHVNTCPTVVLALTDEQVDAFAAECVEKKVIPTKDELDVTIVYYGRYDGRTASISGYDEKTSRRWLAENLLMCARVVESAASAEVKEGA